MLRAFGGNGSSAGSLACHHSQSSVPSSFAQMEQCNHHLHLSSAGLLLWLLLGLFNARVEGMAATLCGTVFSILTTVGVSIGAIGQDALTLNRFVEASMVLGHGTSSLFWSVVAVSVGSG